MAENSQASQKPLDPDTPNPRLIRTLKESEDEDARKQSERPSTESDLEERGT